MPSPQWQAFYNSKAWKKARRAQIDRYPLCNDCGRPAANNGQPANVDHIKRLEDGGHPT